MKQSKKILTFEGAGWSEADSSKKTDVTNCRIRGTFLNDNREKIYLEMMGFEVGKYSPKPLAAFKIPWHITHLFYTKDQKRNWSDDFLDCSKTVKEYTKENILSFINENMNCSFTDLEIDNSSEHDGFSHTGKIDDDFHNDKPRQVEHCGYSSEQGFCFGLTLDNSRKLHEKALQAVAGKNLNQCKENLIRICRMNYQEVYEMAPWAWDNCTPEFPLDVIDFKEVVEYFKSKAGR